MGLAGRAPVRRLVAGMTLLVAMSLVPAAAHGRVLRVGSYRGSEGQFSSIQDAVLAADPGDWVLVGPGDYHENGYAGAEEPAGVLVTTPDMHLRGMNRNRVVVDGTKPGSPTCSSSEADQITKPDGWNGVVVFETDGVTVQNLTVCNYLTSPGGEEGNEIWWNGGDGTGEIGMGSFWGDHLTATSTYSNGTDNPRGEYGIFVSNSEGPGSIRRSYASNMGDADFYVGACPDCNTVLRHVHAQYGALGYSGTNSGGHLVIAESRFDRNKSGIVSNSQNNDDAPSPQIGLCPDQDGAPPGGRICTIYRDNVLAHNNNPNVPGAGSGLAGASPVGTGIVLAGSEYLRLSGNELRHNGSWGILVTDLPDQENPPPISHCEGGVYVIPPPLPLVTCYYQAFGNQLIDNRFTRNNGFFGNPTNGDIGFATTLHDPGNCLHGNTDPDGLSMDPPGLQALPLYNTCGQPNTGDFGPLAAEALCATQLVIPCPSLPGVSYPRTTGVDISMPKPQRTMRDPCAGVPRNPWCPA